MSFKYHADNSVSLGCKAIALRICVIGLVTAVLGLSGCAAVRKRPPSDVRYYLLNVERPQPALAERSGVCTWIRSCRMAGSFAGRSLVYRTGTVLYEPDYYNLFLTNPDAQLTDAMRSWFRQAGMTACVSTEESGIQKYTLEPRIDLFCGDFTNKEKPAAVVQMHVLITTLDKSCACIKTVIDQTYSAETLLPVNPSAAQVVEGLSLSVSKILQQVENDWLETL